MKRLRGDHLGEIVTVSCGGSRISQGAPNPEGVLKSIILQNFCQKLHENERIWTRRRDTSLEPPRIRHWFLYTKFCYMQHLYTIPSRDFIREACCQDVGCFIFMYVIWIHLNFSLITHEKFPKKFDYKKVRIKSSKYKNTTQKIHT